MECILHLQSTAVRWQRRLCRLQLRCLMQHKGDLGKRPENQRKLCFRLSLYIEDRLMDQIAAGKNFLSLSGGKFRQDLTNVLHVRRISSQESFHVSICWGQGGQQKLADKASHISC